VNFRIALVSATAVGLVMSAGAARADDNLVYLDQVGSSNSALITQTGTGNRAGSNAGVLTQSLPENPNPLLAADGRILQFGSSQSLTINQVGNNNEAGASTVNPWLGINQGHSAASINNILSIAQLSSSNIVGRVRQTGSDNSGTITQQGGDTNFIANFYQEHDNVATVTQDGSQNWLGQFGNARVQANGGAIYQAVHYGAANKGSNLTFTQLGDFNLTTRVTQRGGFEAATILVDGNNNTLKMVDQSSGYGSDNLIGNNDLFVTITGDFNGSGLAAMPGTLPGYRTYGTFTPGSNAAGVLGAVATYITDNAVLASSSSFVVPAIPDGTSSFQSSIHQYGAFNLMHFDIAAGDSNQFGLLQGGDYNTFDGDIVGSFNELGLVVSGDSNNVAVLQNGDANDAGVAIKGNLNFINLKQDNGAGAGNNASVTIIGSGNNNSLLNPFLGAAQLALDDVHGDALGDATLGHGDLFQVGDNNSLTLTVASSDNMFASYQKGNNNTITGTIGGGTANQAVVAQIGNTNISNFTQNGASNNLGISQ
jgi:hypothetical protein